VQRTSRIHRRNGRCCWSHRGRGRATLTVIAIVETTSRGSRWHAHTSTVPASSWQRPDGLVLRLFNDHVIHNVKRPRVRPTTAKHRRSAASAKSFWTRRRWVSMKMRCKQDSLFRRYQYHATVLKYERWWRAFQWYRPVVVVVAAICFMHKETEPARYPPPCRMNKWMNTHINNIAPIRQSPHRRWQLQCFDTTFVVLTFSWRTKI